MVTLTLNPDHNPNPELLTSNGNSDLNSLTLGPNSKPELGRGQMPAMVVFFWREAGVRGQMSGSHAVSKAPV